MFSLVSLNCGAGRLQREGEGKGRKRFAEQTRMGLPDTRLPSCSSPRLWEREGLPQASDLILDIKWGRAETIFVPRI